MSFGAQLGLHCSSSVQGPEKWVKQHKQKIHNITKVVVSVVVIVLTEVVALDLGTLCDRELILKKDSISSSLYLLALVAEVLTPSPLEWTFDRSFAFFCTLPMRKSSSSSIEDTPEFLPASVMRVMMK